MGNIQPDSTWCQEWQVGEMPSREARIADELVKFFAEFWGAQSLDEKSKTTRNRYSGALHALGGYLIEKAVLEDDDLDKTTEELLAKYIGPDEGPLICQDNETWQNEIDVVCRKLYKFMRRRG